MPCRRRSDSTSVRSPDLDVIIGRAARAAVFREYSHRTIFPRPNKLRGRQVFDSVSQVISRQCTWGRRIASHRSNILNEMLEQARRIALLPTVGLWADLPWASTHRTGVRNEIISSFTYSITFAPPAMAHRSFLNHGFTITNWFGCTSYSDPDQVPLPIIIFSRLSITISTLETSCCSEVWSAPNISRLSFSLSDCNECNGWCQAETCSRRGRCMWCVFSYSARSWNQLYGFSSSLYIPFWLYSWIWIVVTQEKHPF